MVRSNFLPLAPAAAPDAIHDHLAQRWAHQTEPVLIAWDGEWTRRAVGSAKDAFELSQKLGIPVYDVNRTGYPSRMREWNTRKRSGDA